jgi:hypothetical protein
MKLQGIDIKQVDPDENGGYDIVTNMEVIGVEDELSPPETIEVNDVKFSRSAVVVDEDDENLFWSYWNDGVPAINLQLWFS